MRKVLEFNDRVDDLRRQNERELLTIEARRQRNIANAEDLRHELQAAFAELETVVEKGRHRINLEHQRQTRIRSANLRVLEEETEKLINHHAGEVQRLVDDENRRIQIEDEWFNFERQRIEAEREDALFLATAQNARGGSSTKNGNRGACRGSGSSRGCVSYCCGHVVNQYLQI